MDIDRINRVLERMAERLNVPYCAYAFEMTALDGADALEEAVHTHIAARRQDDPASERAVVVTLSPELGSLLSAVVPYFDKWLLPDRSTLPYDRASQRKDLRELQELLAVISEPAQVFEATVTPPSWGEPNWNYVCICTCRDRWLLELGTSPT